MLTNFTSNMMVVKLMIILTWIFATVSRLELGRRIIRLLFVAWPCLGVCSQKTVSISALMGCCCAGLGMRRPGHWPPPYLIFSPGCSLAGLPGQSCLLPARGRGERGEGGTFVNKTVTWTGSQPGQLCQARLTLV